MGPPSPQFDADCVLKGINDHVQAMQERIGELESELARSIALNVELAANLAASLDIESTASEKRGRAEEELAALQGRYDELRRSTSTSSREIERLTGQMNQANEANTALQCLRSSQETRMAEYETRLALTLQENERLMNEIEELKGEMKRKDGELGKLRNKTTDLSNDVRDMDMKMKLSDTRLRVAMQESERLRSSSAERMHKLKQDMAELAEENNSNKARLAEFEEDSTLANILPKEKCDQIEKLEIEAKRKDDKLRNLRDKTSDLSKDLRDMNGSPPERRKSPRLAGLPSVHMGELEEEEPACASSSAPQLKGDEESFTLYDPDDGKNINELHTIIRRDIWEGFVVNDGEDDRDAVDQGGGNGRLSYYAGTVGFRCRWCRDVDPSLRAEKSAVYPRKLERIYSASIRFQRDHVP